MAHPTNELPPARKGVPAPASLQERRRLIADSRKDHPLAAGVEVVERRRGGVVGIECTVGSPRCTILHFHGGGYRLGEPRTWVAWGTQLAKIAHANVVLSDYRLAPEHPFPTGIHDAVAVYRALIADQASPVVISGDSAGGGIAVALAAASGMLGLPRAAGLLLLSPWLDLTVESETYVSCKSSDQMFSREMAIEAAGQYLQGVDARDPLASPLFADLRGFPPVQIFAGTAEVLLGDATSFANRAARAGVSVEAHFVAGMQHVWPTVFIELKESAAAMEAIGRFISARTSAT